MRLWKISHYHWGISQASKLRDSLVLLGIKLNEIVEEFPLSLEDSSREQFKKFSCLIGNNVEWDCERVPITFGEFKGFSCLIEIVEKFPLLLRDSSRE